LSAPPEFDRRWVVIARVLRPRGNKGEVAAELLTDFPARISSLRQVYLSKDEGDPRPVGLRRFWVDRNHPGRGVFHFEGCVSIQEAEEFRGCDVLLSFEDRVELPAGQYFVSELIGCVVFEIAAGESKLVSPACAAEQAPSVLGTVRDVYFPGEELAGTPLLEVQTSRGALLIPLAGDICTRIDVATRRIEVRLPEGLREMNTPQ
jgi:16S rRNA processing protein RimM